MPASVSTAAYLYILSLDPPGRAWEYLRRNAGYGVDWHRQGPGQGDVAADRVRLRAEPWGLRFPGGPRPRRARG